MTAQLSPNNQDKNDVVLYVFGVLAGVILAVVSVTNPALLPFPQIISVILSAILFTVSLGALVLLIKRSAAAQEESVWMVILTLWHWWR